MIYRFIPFFLSKYYQSNLAKKHQTTEAKLQLVPEWILAAESLTLLVEFDAWYTMLVNALNTLTAVYVPICAISKNVIIVWVLWALFILTFIVVLYYTINVQYFRNCKANRSCVASNFLAVILVGFFAVFLMSNDYNPLPYCYIKNVAKVYIVQIVLKVLVLMVFITVILLLLFYRCLSKTRQEKLLSRILYQQLSSSEQLNEETNLLTAVTDNDQND